MQRAIAVLGLTMVLVMPSIATKAQQAVPPTATADYAAAHGAIAGKLAHYLQCVAAIHTESLKAQIEKRMPISTAFYDISRGGRGCEGFNDFWPVIYQAGFRSPEEFYQMEMETAKAAVTTKANIDPTQLGKRLARLVFLRDAVIQNPDMPANDKAKAHDALSKMILTLEGLRPTDGSLERVKPVLEAYNDFYLNRFPPEHVQLAGEAFEFAKVEEASTEDVLGSVRGIQ